MAGCAVGEGGAGTDLPALQRLDELLDVVGGVGVRLPGRTRGAGPGVRAVRPLLPTGLGALQGCGVLGGQRCHGTGLTAPDVARCPPLPRLGGGELHVA